MFNSTFGATLLSVQLYNNSSGLATVQWMILRMLEPTKIQYFTTYILFVATIGKKRNPWEFPFHCFAQAGYLRKCHDFFMFYRCPRKCYSSVNY